jgi:GNAT superfamily N-acetyltransferase
MGIEIKAMTPELLADYLRFFDGVAFSDHAEWSWCYCTFYHLGKDDEKRIEETHKGAFNRDIMRDIAIGFINDGTLKGYLAYEDDAVVGWLNTQDKGNYAKIRESAELWENDTGAKIKAITCFLVAPEMRRRGVATALLARAVEDAAREGYDFAEAYPGNGALDCFQHYHGHPAMYESCGFAPFKRFEYYSIYRRALK